MGSDFRRNNRIYHKDLIDYKVFFMENGNYVQGGLGNISESGLCAIMPIDFSIQAGDELQGYLSYAPQRDEMDISGRVAWVTDYEHHGTPQIMLGVEFFTPLHFPEHLMALSMSFEG